MVLSRIYLGHQSLHKLHGEREICVSKKQKSPTLHTNKCQDKSQFTSEIFLFKEYIKSTMENGNNVLTDLLMLKWQGKLQKDQDSLNLMTHLI